MANYIAYNILSGRGHLRPPRKFGYVIVPIYGSIHITKKTEEWVDENVVGNWTWFVFGNPTNGIGYCFEQEEDAFAFKMRFA